MARFWLVAASIFGLLSVALGAFGAHSLKNVLDDYGRSVYEKAALYQMFHTMALFAVGLIQHLDKETSFSMAGWGFFIGIILFSGSLYLLALTGMKWLGAITPFGGVSFLVGWFFLAWSLVKGRF
ncbi:MAG TPA: DUF423 domain-containing protein [Thermodesulfobacteriota bacterium]|nr:DUF423 domain-containing protein [Thermodesulfobacteriota bacterium]